jgi:hypothetical protein
VIIYGVNRVEIVLVVVVLVMIVAIDPWQIDLSRPPEECGLDGFGSCSLEERHKERRDNESSRLQNCSRAPNKEVEKQQNCGTERGNSGIRDIYHVYVEVLCAFFKFKSNISLDLTCIQQSSSLTHSCTDFIPSESGARHDRYREHEVAKTGLRAAELCQRFSAVTSVGGEAPPSTAPLILWDVKVASAIFSP